MSEDHMTLNEEIYHMSCSIQVDTAAFSTNMFPTEILQVLGLWGSLDRVEAYPPQ